MATPIDDTAVLEAVKEKAQQVKIEKLSFSVRELKSMYEDGQINIQPDFQRVFRWSAKQRSSLIESVLLSIPLPTVFVAADIDGNWDVVDGVQRLSTLFSFMGVKFDISEITEDSAEVSQAPDDDLESEPLDDLRVPMGPFALENLELLDEADGLDWHSLPIALKRKIEQSRIDVTIVDSSSSPETKYNLFLRLNSGSVLSAQELRNAMLVMISPEFFESMKRCSQFDEFREITKVSKRKQREAFQDELVLRFFMQLDFDKGRKALRQDFGEVLTDWAKEEAVEASKATPHTNSARLNEKLFMRTVHAVRIAGGEDALRRYDQSTDTRRGPVSNAAFEFVMSGVGKHVDYWEDHLDLLSERLLSFWGNPKFEKFVGSGQNARDRFPVLVNNGREFFKPNCEG